MKRGTGGTLSVLEAFSLSLCHLFWSVFTLGAIGPPPNLNNDHQLQWSSTFSSVNELAFDRSLFLSLFHNNNNSKW